MKRLFLLTVAMLLVGTATTQGATVAKEDFDGGAVNLSSSVVPALDGGPGDYFGVGSRNGWPQGFPSPGVPFSLADDSNFGYSNGGSAFPGDTEGIFGENSDLDNNYFAISDSDEFLADQTASWTFDVTGFTNLVLRIDMGSISNSSSDGFSIDTDVKFTAQIDADPVQLAFDLDAVDNTVGFVTRPMDVGSVSGGGRLLVASGDNPVKKLLAESGSTAADQFLDKTPADGRGAGLMDTFATPIKGTGAALVLTLTADFPFEAMAFDNIVIEGTDESTPANTTSWGRIKKLYNN